MTFGVFSEHTAREIHRRVMGVPTGNGSNPAGQPQQGQVFYVITDEALLPATDPFTGYTQCDCVILRYVEPPDVANPFDMEEATGAIATLTVVNRSAFLSLPIGTLMIVMFIGQEWAPIWADCASPSSSSVISGSSIGPPP